MKRLILFCALFSIVHIHAAPGNRSETGNFSNNIHVISDSLPSVLTKNHADLLESRLRSQAVLQFGTHQLPGNLKDWEAHRAHLRDEIIKKAGVIIDYKLPLNIKETATIQMKGYRIKNITIFN